MKALAFVVLLFVSIQLPAQCLRDVTPVSNTNGLAEKNISGLEAKFVASVTEGIVPLKVQFTDQSTGGPISWKWEFGDGDSSLVQHPSHTYRTMGAYTVRLTISDGKNGFTLEKKDFIRVNLSLNACDTMHFPLPLPLTYYTIPEKGYVSGNNSYGDKAICDYFDNLQTIAITGVFFQFCKAKRTQAMDEKIAICIWKPEFSTGEPGNLIYSDTLMLSKCVNDYISDNYTSVSFLHPIQVDGPFFMGIKLPVETGDTLALWSTAVTKIPVNTGWVMTTDGNWSSAKDLWPAIGEQPFIISNAIFPKVCRVDGIAENKASMSFAIFPNPVTGKLRLVLNDDGFVPISYQVLDMTGLVMSQGLLSVDDFTIEISRLKPGFYLLRIADSQEVRVQKFVRQ